MNSDNVFSTIEDAILQIQNGGLIVVADDQDRENEGDLVGAAENITPEQINFMLKNARGLICVSMPKDRATNLELPLMIEESTDPHNTAFTVTVDAGAEFGVSTGVSASDRATTIQRLASANAHAQDFTRPGHISPLQAKRGGVLRRVGHTEAATDFARLAGLSEVGVICEIMNDDGTMARRNDLAEFAKKYDLPFVTITQLIEYRLERERYVMRKVVKEIETKYGAFTAVAYKDTLDGVEHLALVKGPLEALKTGSPLVRVQHENMITDVLGNHENENTQHQMAQAMNYINEQGSGVVVYLRHTEDSHQGLINSLKQYSLDDKGKDFEKRKYELRDYGVGAQILVDLGIKSFRMLSQSNRKIVGLRGYGLDIVEVIQMPSGQFDFLRQTSTDAQEDQGSQTSGSTHFEPVAAPVPAPFVAKEEPKKTEANENKNELRAEPKTEPKAEPAAEPRVMTMRMGGQIMSGQALFEG